MLENQCDSNLSAQNLPLNTPANKTLYICRRIQLLKEADKKPEKWKNYLRMRSMLLKQRCGTAISNTAENRSLSKVFSKMSLNDSNIVDKSNRSSIVATKEAKASQAIVGGNSIVENYSFVGVHHIFDQHKSCVTMVKFANNDSSLLCCCSMDGKLSICNVSFNPSVVSTLEGHTAGVTAFDWSENNDIIASVSLDSTVRIWSVERSECLGIIKTDDSKYFICLFQPANNNLLVVGNNAGELRVANISTSRFSKETCKLTGCILTLAFDSLGKILWAGNDRGEIFSIRCDIDGRLTKTKRLCASPSSISSLSFKVWINREARDPMLLVNSANNTICLYSVLDSDGTLALKRTFHNKHEFYAIKSTFCPMMSFREGACVVTGSEDGNVYFLDIEKPSQRSCINTLQGHAKPVIGVSFSYNELLLATSDLEGLLIVWKRTDLPQAEPDPSQ